MIGINALALLLLTECAVLLMALSVFLFFRNRRHKRLYRKALDELVGLKGASRNPADHEAEENRKKAAAAGKGAGEAAHAQVLHEKELLTVKVAELEKALQEDAKRFEDLQKKHSTLENEYSILYGKHFETQGKKDPE
jgi:hypothetical protein